uniref:Rap guanine nucleotide exchange factor 2 n=1 Tax=Globodera pallida TaxID=36090 RepID=A0A183CCX3_GLOPA
HSSNSVSSSSEASSSQQQQQQAQNTLNVRIRHQSPHQQQRQSGRPRAGTPSSISLASNARWPTAAAAWTVSSSTTADETDCFAGLPETVVDSDGGGSDGDEDEEEDDEVGSCPSRDSELRDVVRECLEKPPDQRSAEDMAILIEFMDSLPSLAALPMAIKRQLSLKMVFAHVPNKGTVIMQHGERIDAWSVVVNGSVEKLHSDGQRTECQVGDCFGAKPIAQSQFNDGEIRTMVEHAEFYAIMSSLSRQIEQEQDKSGMLVLEVERRIITKASPDRLLQQLLVGDESAVAAAGGEEVPTDSHFVEDFLLMHRVFFRDSVQIAHRLLRWFREEPKHRDRVARIMLIWLNNHFEDFEGGQSAGQMTGLLDEFDELLANAKMFNHQSLLSITVSVKSQPRMITLTRSDRAEELNFQLVGGNNGIFVMSVDPNSAAERAGIKRWDELLEVNGQFCRCMSLPKALDLLRESTHLSISVKTNWIGFKEALLSHQNGGDQADSAALSSPAVNPPSSSATLRANATSTNWPASRRPCHPGKQQQLHHFQHEHWHQQQPPSQRNLRNGCESASIEDDGTLDMKRHQKEAGVEQSTQQLQQQNCSSANSKAAPSYLKEVMAAGSSSTVQQKKCLFERKCSSSPSRPLSPTALKRKNSSVEKSPRDVLIVPNAKNTDALAEHGDMNGEGPPNAEESAVHGTSKNPFASNFHRLSRVRLNMSRKLHSSNSVSSSSEASSSQQQQQAQNTLNVRIRHQSPHQQQRQSGRPRAGTPSSISLASNARWPTAAAAWTVSSSTTADETDCFAGLPETVVDSDGGGSDGDEDEEEDDEVGSCPSRDSARLELRDVVRECLEKPPDQRSAEDMAILIEFMDSLPTLAALPMAIKRQLSLKMVFAHVPNKGTVIMQHGERIDAWSVVVNGSVEKLHSDGQRTECQVGDCFGAKPIAQSQFNDGEIRTMVNDCEFILVEHAEFYAIMSSLSRQIEQEQDKSGMLDD